MYVLYTSWLLSQCGPHKVQASRPETMALVQASVEGQAVDQLIAALASQAHEIHLMRQERIKLAVLCTPVVRAPLVLLGRSIDTCQYY